MARTKKDAAAPAAEAPAEQPAATGADVRRMIPQKKLNDLLRRCDSYKKQIDPLVGELREHIGNAVEKDHLHKRAFAVVRACKKMSAEKLAEFLDHLQYYLDASGEYDRAESVPRLDLTPQEDGEGTEEGAGPAEEPAPPAENVSRPKFGQPREAPAAAE